MRGNITKRTGAQGTAYRVRVELPRDEQGRRRSRSVTCKTKREAERELARILFHGLSEKGSNLSESDRLGGGSPFATCSHCGRETLRAYLVNIEPGDIACSPVWVCRKCAEGYGWYSQGGAWHHNELRPYGEGSDD